MSELAAGEIKRLELLNYNVSTKPLKPHQLMAYVKDYLAESLVARINLLSYEADGLKFINPNTASHDERVNLTINWFRQHGNIRAFKQCVNWCTPALSKHGALHNLITIETGLSRVAHKLSIPYKPRTKATNGAAVNIEFDFPNKEQLNWETLHLYAKEILTSKDSRFDIETIVYRNGKAENLVVESNKVVYKYIGPIETGGKLKSKDVSDIYARVFIWCLYHHM